MDTLNMTLADWLFAERVRRFGKRVAKSKTPTPVIIGVFRTYADYLTAGCGIWLSLEHLLNYTRRQVRPHDATLVGWIDASGNACSYGDGDAYLDRLALVQKFKSAGMHHINACDTTETQRGGIQWHRL